jgi:hypothetical protein
LIIEAALDLIEADDIGSKLGECHPAERRGYKRRSFDHS